MLSPFWDIRGRGSGSDQDEWWRGFGSLDRDDCVAPLAGAVIAADDFEGAVFAVFEFELVGGVRVIHADLHLGADAILNWIAADLAFESLHGCISRGLIDLSHVELDQAFGLGGEGDVAGNSSADGDADALSGVVLEHFEVGSEIFDRLGGGEEGYFVEKRARGGGRRAQGVDEGCACGGAGEKDQGVNQPPEVSLP